MTGKTKHGIALFTNLYLYENEENFHKIFTNILGQPSRSSHVRLCVCPTNCKYEIDQIGISALCYKSQI